MNLMRVRKSVDILCWCLYLFISLSTTKLSNSIIIKSARYCNSFVLRNSFRNYKFNSICTISTADDRKTTTAHQMTNTAGPDYTKPVNPSLDKISITINKTNATTASFISNNEGQIKQRSPSNIPPIIEFIKSLCMYIYYKISIAIMDIRSNRLKPLLSFRLTRKWVVRSVLLTGLLVLLKRVIAFANSLVLEISFANFLKLLKESPERIKHLQVCR